MKRGHVCIQTPLYVHDWNFEIVVLEGYSWDLNKGPVKSTKVLATKGYVYVPITHPFLNIPNLNTGFIHPNWNPDFPLTYLAENDSYMDNMGRTWKLQMETDFHHTGKYRLYDGKFSVSYTSHPMTTDGLITIFKVFKSLRPKTIWGEYFGSLNGLEFIVSEKTLVACSTNLIS